MPSVVECNSRLCDRVDRSKIIEVWLSLVERRVRDAEAASSNLVTSIYMAPWSSGQDAALSRRKQGFDSPTGYLKNLGFIPGFFLF